MTDTYEERKEDSSTIDEKRVEGAPLLTYCSKFSITFLGVNKTLQLNWLSFQRKSPEYISVDSCMYSQNTITTHPVLTDAQNSIYNK